LEPGQIMAGQYQADPPAKKNPSPPGSRAFTSGGAAKQCATSFRHSRKFAYPRKSFVWFSIVGDILASLDHLVGELLELVGHE
jgi:hypothetical protein